MLKVKLTENNLGLTISGDYDDLDFLYDSIFHIIKGEPVSEIEECMGNHILGFLYDLRHAYQGDREYELRDNFPNINKKNIPKKNLYYSFNYVITDLFIDMLLIRHFLLKNNRFRVDNANSYENNVSLFYSLVLESLEPIFTPTKMKKIRKSCSEMLINDKLYYPQWFENISCDYINTKKEKRAAVLSKTLDAICNYNLYADYPEMKKEIINYCKENNCLLSNVRIGDYPEETEW